MSETTAQATNEIFTKLSNLNKEQADAICTAVFLGFSSDTTIITAGKYIKGQGTTGRTHVFSYETDSDKSEYEKLRDIINSILPDAKIEVCKTIDKTDQLLIGAKSGGVSNPNAISTTLSNNEITICKQIDTLVTKLTNYLPGAYIGISLDKDTQNRMGIHGPSQLSLEDPRYRKISGNESAEIQKNYNNAKLTTNTVNNALQGFKTNTKNTNIDLLIDTNTPVDYQLGKLFKSRHGMIVAIENSIFSPDKLYFEISAGKDTTKVCSCFPCATFMRASGIPATAIHLGRGDNWTCNTKYAPWKESINYWYYLGSTILKRKGKGSNLVEIKDDNGYAPTSNSRFTQSNLWEIFLESLTFESSFKEKITNTLEVGK